MVLPWLPCISSNIIAIEYASSPVAQAGTQMRKVSPGFPFEQFWKKLFFQVFVGICVAEKLVTLMSKS